MRALTIAVVVLLCIIFVEKNAKPYIVPFSIAAFIFFIAALLNAALFGIEINDLLCLKSDSFISNSAMTSVYIALIIVVISAIKS